MPRWRHLGTLVSTPVQPGVPTVSCALRVRRDGQAGNAGNAQQYGVDLALMFIFTGFSRQR